MSVVASRRPGSATGSPRVVFFTVFPKKINPHEVSLFYHRLLENVRLRSMIPTLGERSARGEYSRWATGDLKKEAKTLRDDLIQETHILLVAETIETNPLDLFAMRDKLFAIIDELDKRDGSGSKLLEGKTDASSLLIEAIRELNFTERSYWP